MFDIYNGTGVMERHGNFDLSSNASKEWLELYERMKSCVATEGLVIGLGPRGRGKTQGVSAQPI